MKTGMGLGVGFITVKGIEVFIIFYFILLYLLKFQFNMIQ